MGRIRQALLAAGARMLTKPRGEYQRHQPNNLGKLRRLIRKGDIVSMWMRIEYKHPQSPLDHRSALSHDDWDCAKKQRSTTGVFFYKYNNLQTDRPEPEHSTNLLRNWEKVQPGTVGEALLSFACSIQNAAAVLRGERPEFVVNPSVYEQGGR